MIINASIARSLALHYHCSQCATKCKTSTYNPRFTFANGVNEYDTPFLSPLNSYVSLRAGACHL